MYYVGFDIGSSSIQVAVIDEKKNLVFVMENIPHFGTPLKRLPEIWQKINNNLDGKIVSTSFTGIGAQHFNKVFPELLFDYESVTIPKGVFLLEPNVSYVFHIGAKDSYFLRLAEVEGEINLLEWSANSKCGGGSGILIEKQLRRLYLKDDKKFFNTDNPDHKQKLMDQIFIKAESDIKEFTDLKGFNARCGVIIQSDLIHEQNEGAQKPYLVAKLYTTVARNFKNDVLGARELDPSLVALATGGVFSSDYILNSFNNLSGLKARRPKHHMAVAAIGIAVEALEKNNNFVMDFDQLFKITDFSKEKRFFAEPLYLSLDKVHIFEQEITRTYSQEVREVTIGVDGGSTTTKAAIVDVETGELLDKIYISTHGDPEGALKEVFRYLSKNADKYDVLGVCTTGSARKLYERILISQSLKKSLEKEGFIVLDGAVDEITCHAKGIKFHDPDIDTIFEIGGQDMKFTSFKVNGNKATDQIKEARMNYSCQAGAGQTLENMAQILDLDVKSTLQEAALKAEIVPIIDSTCGVFMEMEENRLISEGFSKEEIAAAIVRSTAASYFNKFVGGPQHVQDKCSCQGGPALGKAFLAAMAQVTRKDIYAYPHRELFGAWGAGLFLREEISEARKKNKTVKSAFRGFEVVDMEFDKKDVLCSEHFGKLSCKMRNCKLKIFTIGDEKIITGGFCPRGNSEGADVTRTDYVEIYHKIFDKHFDGITCDQLDKLQDKSIPTVGIHRSGITLGEMGIWAATLLKSLGFMPVITPVSNEEIAQRGINIAPTEFCIAMKLVLGHADLLAKDKRIKHLFNPAPIEEIRDKKPYRKFCIYTEAEGYLIQDIIGLEPQREILPIIYWKDNERTSQSLYEEFKRIGYNISKKEILEATYIADKKVLEFKEDLNKQGERFMKELEKSGEIGYVGLGRDYVILDPQASSESGTMFTKQRGMRYIPQTFLEDYFKDIPIDDLSYNEYWYQNAHILQASIFVARHPKLFPIRQMNFACGPDSVKFYHEDEIFKRVEKPFLHLVTDAQTNNAPFVTRAEAHERVVKKATPKTNLDMTNFVLFPDGKHSKKLKLGEKLWLIPYMGEASNLGVSILKHYGIESKVISSATPKAKEYSDRFITTEVCFPLRGVVGDVMAELEELAEKKGKDWINENIVLFLPTTAGPCRFGKYGEVLKIFLRQEGMEGISLISPSADVGYFDIDVPEQFDTFSSKVDALVNIFRAVKMADMTDDLIRRFRPYCDDFKKFDEVCDQRWKSLQHLLINHGASLKLLKKWVKETTEIFSELAPTAEDHSLPLVLYIGEIYTRQHDPYADYVIQKIEEERLEIIRGSIAEWLEYVMYITNRRNPNFLFGFVEKYMAFVDWRFKRIFGNHLHERHVVPKPRRIIEDMQDSRRYHGDIMGESPLVIGTFLKFLNGELSNGRQRVSGIFHVGPFTCMQEGVAMAKIDAIIKEEAKHNPTLVVPIIHAFFGESANTNLEAEIAAFREQCYLKHKLITR
ncbi:MAG TPA: acyl-CoA dehydratase activase-related protein [Defluviitoga sp.]|nr:acyl-CoA dehydratase activase-related protein [Defluviitoga sp.]HOP25366.1 acyl-CoA dehydratase activase-related protein [Defluviitoga sp.]HPZ29524.1 acyl-CoA dehydratase activase-related protein [Defluviitoga sp.]HQD63336.1 acyl-CoA dehydratase activase-related protein [Defluviitoga sp.]